VESLNAAPDTGFEPPAADAGTESTRPITSSVRRSFIMRNRVRATMAAGVFALLGIMVVVTHRCGGGAVGRRHVGTRAHRGDYTPFQGFRRRETFAFRARPAAPAEVQAPSGEDLHRQAAGAEKGRQLEPFRHLRRRVDATTTKQCGCLERAQPGLSQVAPVTARHRMLRPRRRSSRRRTFCSGRTSGRSTSAIQAPIEGLKAFERAAHAERSRRRDAWSMPDSSMSSQGRIPEARSMFDKGAGR